MNPAILASIMAAICRVESSNVHTAVNVVDGGGASYGLCQIKLTTARMLGFRGHPTELWLNPEVNREWAAKYLTYQYERYGDWNKAIAAYNAGSLRGGKIRNTRYVRKVKLALAVQ